jgi:hypothetical protein
VVLAVVGAAGILALGARAGREASGASGSTAVGSGSAVPLGDGLVANAQPIELSAVSTSDPPPRVVAFYEAAFRKRGLVPLSRSTPLLGHVSAFDPHDRRQRFATALATQRGDTLVLVGATDPSRAPRPARASRDVPYPLPALSHGLLAYTSDDGGVHADTGQFVTSLPASAVLAFYRDRLGREGFSASTPAPSEAFATFSKAGGETVTIAVQALDATRGSAVLLARTKPR